MSFRLAVVTGGPGAAPLRVGGIEGIVGSPRMLLVLTKSAAWSLICGGIAGLGTLADRKSLCVVILRKALPFGGAAFTYTGPVAVGLSFFRGPAGIPGSGHAFSSFTPSNLLCTEGTGRPRSKIEAAGAGSE